MNALQLTSKGQHSGTPHSHPTFRTRWQDTKRRYLQQPQPQPQQQQQQQEQEQEQEQQQQQEQEQQQPETTPGVHPLSSFGQPWAE